VPVDGEVGRDHGADESGKEGTDDEHRATLPSLVRWLLTTSRPPTRPMRSVGTLFRK
jgi:hypothetical protein